MKMLQTLLCALIMLGSPNNGCHTGTVKTIKSYTEVKGNSTPYVEIKDHTIYLTKCSSGMCTIYTSVDLTVYNPLMWGVKARADCIYKLDGKPFDKITGKWFIIPSKSKVILNSVDHLLVAVLSAPTDVTISCGITWQQQQMVKAFMSPSNKPSIILKSNYAKSIIKRIIPPTISRNK